MTRYKTITADSISAVVESSLDALRFYAQDLEDQLNDLEKQNQILENTILELKEELENLK